MKLIVKAENPDTLAKLEEFAATLEGLQLEQTLEDESFCAVLEEYDGRVSFLGAFPESLAEITATMRVRAILEGPRYTISESTAFEMLMQTQGSQEALAYFNETLQEDAKKVHAVTIEPTTLLPT